MPLSIGRSLALFAQTSDGVMAIGPDCRILSWNRAAQTLLGYTTPEACGRRCHDIIRGLDAHGNVFCQAHCPVLVMTRRRELPHAYDVTACTKQGVPRQLNVSTVVLRSRAGPVVVHLFRSVSAHEANGRLAGSRPDRPTPVLAALDGSGPATRLTRRERDVLQLMAHGHSTDAIARRLSITRTTARSHIQNVLGKLGAHTRLEAVVRAMRPVWDAGAP